MIQKNAALVFNNNVLLLYVVINNSDIYKHINCETVFFHLLRQHLMLESATVFDTQTVFNIKVHLATLKKNFMKKKTGSLIIVIIAENRCILKLVSFEKTDD